MEYRRLGSTEFMVSEIGLGTVEIGQDYAGSIKPCEKDAIDLLNFACDNGINYYDTAAGYGNSERLIGKAFAGNRKVIIATKVARIDPSITKTSIYRQIIGSSIENSCRLLKRDYLDIVQLHSADAAMIEDGRIMDELERLKKRGYLRFIGATVYDLDAAEAVIADGRFAVVQAPYSLLDRRFAGVFPKFAQLGIGVIARSVLARGILAGNSWALAHAPQKVAVVYQEFAQLSDMYVTSTIDLAYGYVLSNGDVNTALVGTADKSELGYAIGLDESVLSDEIIERVQEISVDEEYVDIRKWG